MYNTKLIRLQFPTKRSIHPSTLVSATAKGTSPSHVRKSKTVHKTSVGTKFNG